MLIIAGFQSLPARAAGQNTLKAFRKFSNLQEYTNYQNNGDVPHPVNEHTTPKSCFMHLYNVKLFTADGEDYTSHENL